MFLEPRRFCTDHNQYNLRCMTISEAQELFINPEEGSDNRNL